MFDLLLFAPKAQQASLSQEEQHRKIRPFNHRLRRWSGIAGVFFFLALSSTSTQAGVSAGGDFNHSIPLTLPQATQQLRPDLALAYSSSRGNGLLGVGWYLSGLSAISRTPNERGVQYDGSDSYLGPEGQLVDISGTGMLFHAKSENWTQYEPQGNCGSAGPCQWTRTTRDGVKYYYGFTNDSRIEAFGRNGAVRVWALNRVEDRFGNFYDVQYDEDAATGDFRVRSVVYTLGNGRGASQAKRVDFIYENRPDQYRIPASGASVGQTQRLAHIDIYAGADLFFRYQLGYEQSQDSGNSRLTTVSELGADGVSRLRIQKFTWQDATLTGTALPNNLNGSWGVSQAEWAIDGSQLHFGDFNGDGRRDLLLQPKGNGSAKLLLANQIGGFATARDITNNYGMNNAAWARTGHLIHVVDFNQDSFDDVILQGLNQGQATLYLESDGKGGFKPVADIAGQLGLSQAQLSGDSVIWQLGDFNGDRMLDFYLMPIFMHQPGFMLYGKAGGGYAKSERNNSAWGLPEMATPDVTVAPTPNFMMRRIDINLDGRPDLLFLPYNEQYETYLALSTPTGYQGLNVVTNAYGLNKSHWNSANYTLLTRDLDADGLDDLIFLPKNTSMTPLWARHNGQGFDQAASLNNVWGISADKWATDQYALRWLNLQGGGRASLYFLSKDAVQPSWIAKADSVGGYQAPRSLDGIMGFSRADWGEANSILNSIDLNADGNIDLLFRGKTVGDASKVWLSTPGKRDALVHLDNGAGASMQLTYQTTLDHPGAVVPGSAGGLGHADKTLRYLVTNVTQSNGRGTNLAHRYNYQNVRYLPGDRNTAKYLGFASRTTIVEPLGLSKVDIYHQDVPYQGLLMRSESRDDQGHLMTVDSYKWEQVQHYPKVFSTRKIWQQQQVFERGVLYKTSTSQRTFGPYDSVSERLDCVDADCRRNRTVYRDDLARWILRQPIETMEFVGSNVVSGSRYQYADDRITSVEGFFCSDSTQCTLADGVWLVTNQGLEYDSSGNLIAAEDGMGNRSAFEFDPVYNAYLQRVTNALGHRISKEYNAAGQVLVERDPAGNETRYSYDVFGRSTRITRPDGSYSTKIYSTLGDANAQWTLNQTTTSKLDEPLQLSERTEYFDGFANVYLVSQSGDQGQLIQTERKLIFQKGGTIERTSLPYFKGTSAQWIQKKHDLRRRLVRLVRPDGMLVSYAYGPGRITQTNAKGQKETGLFDHFGRLQEARNRLGQSIFYHYDFLGNRIQVDLPNGQQILQSFDSFNRLRQMQDPSVGMVRYDYDRNGNKVGVTDNLGRVMRFEFDSLNRITRRISADGEVTSFAYDDSALPNSTGRLSRVVDPARTIEFAYDALGRKSAEAVQFGALPAVFTRNWTYNLAGQVISESVPKFGPAPATVQSYDYTPGGNLFQVKVDGQVYAQYDGHNAYGQPSTRTLDPGLTSQVVSQFSYDLRGLMTGTTVTDARGLELQNLSYGFDVLGNVGRIDDFTRYAEEEGDDHDQGHHYGQEKDRDEHDGKDSKKPEEYGKSYYHDREKDRDRDRNDILAAGVNLSQSQIFEYDALDQLVRATGAYGDKNYAYDRIGNMTHIGAAVDRDFTYNGTQLIAGTRTEVTYDGVGAMTGKLHDGLEWAYRYNTLGHLTEVYKNGGLLQANAYDYRGQRILQRVYQGDHHHKVHTTFYPTPGLQVKHDHRSNKFVVTKSISAGAYGKLASFDEHYAFGERDEAGQWLAYSQMFDQGTPKGFAMALSYRALAKVSEPRFLANLPYAFFCLLSLGVLLVLARGQIKAGHQEVNDPSRFGLGNRLVSLSMVFMMFWLTACGSGGGNGQGNGAPLALGDPTTLTGETLDDDLHTEGTSEDLSASEEELAGLNSGDLLAQLVQTRPMTDKVFFHPNHIQTATLITDSHGHVAARIRHLPYGEVDVQATVDHRTAAKQYASFTGQELDESTGLIYYNARFYDPSLGRFISPDSIVDGDGTAAVHFNRYAYVRNNPTNYTDPTGHSTTDGNILEWGKYDFQGQTYDTLTLQNGIRVFWYTAIIWGDFRVSGAPEVDPRYLKSGTWEVWTTVFSYYPDGTVVQSYAYKLETSIYIAGEELPAICYAWDGDYSCIAKDTRYTDAVLAGNSPQTSAEAAAYRANVAAATTFSNEYKSTLHAPAPYLYGSNGSTTNGTYEGSDGDQGGSGRDEDDSEDETWLEKNRKKGADYTQRSVAFWYTLEAVGVFYAISECSGAPWPASTVCTDVAANQVGYNTGYQRARHAEGKSVEDAKKEGRSRGRQDRTLASAISLGITLASFFL